MRLITGILIWMLRLVLFGAFFAFALHNRHTVMVYDWFGNPIETGMVAALGIAVLIGLILGFIIPLPRLWRYRQERNAYRQRLPATHNKSADHSMVDNEFADATTSNYRIQGGIDGY